VAEADAAPVVCSARQTNSVKERVSEPAQLVAARGEVARGGSFIDPRIVETVVSARTRAADSPLAELTPREHDVLAEMAQGKTNAAIAEVLTLTTRAVERQINSLFAKLPLEVQSEVDRRVKVVLLFLAEQ
jgi:DNA-binding NarL/FixJ family response regulator